MTRGKEFRHLVSVEEALEAIGRLPVRPRTETVPLSDATHRVLAEPVTAPLDVPGFDRAAMDGFAVRARDTFGAAEDRPVRLRVLGTSHAGRTSPGAVAPGLAIEIGTGGEMPPGADAVVMVEDTDRDADGDVQVRRAVAPGDHVMGAGSDIARGSRALSAGTALSPREIGLLAALGLDRVRVSARPRIAILSTGDELVPPGGRLDGPRIHDVNGPALAAAAVEAGAAVGTVAVIGDERSRMEKAILDAAATHDAVVTSGSTSASAADQVYRILEERGRMLLHGIAVRPGKPTAIGLVADTPFFGLPGYPVSALTIFSHFVVPYLRRAQGLAPRPATPVPAELATLLPNRGGRAWFAPVGLVADADLRLLAYPVDRGSGATTSLVDAEGYVWVRENVNHVAAGSPVAVFPFGELRVPPVVVAAEPDAGLPGLLAAVPGAKWIRTGGVEAAAKVAAGIADAALTTAEPAAGRRVVDHPGPERAWGLLVRAEHGGGLADLARSRLRIVLREAGSDARRRFEALPPDIRDGFVVAGTARSPEAALQRLLSGRADIALSANPSEVAAGLRFVPLGRETVRLLVDGSRAAKPGVAALVAAWTARR
ncbi:MAG: molybdopterin biosynthesis protein [Methanobacteriota archaeon]